MQAAILILVLLKAVFAVHDGQPISAKSNFNSQLSRTYAFGDTGFLMILEMQNGRLWLSEDYAGSWKPVDDLSGISHVAMHPYNEAIAYALTTDHQHWITKDYGREWKSFGLPNYTSPSFSQSEVLHFHETNDDTVIINAQTCQVMQNCTEVALYTTNSFATIQVLRADTAGCRFAQPLSWYRAFKNINMNRTLCVVRSGSIDSRPKQTLLVSDDWFSTEIRPTINHYGAFNSLAKLEAASGFLIATVEIEHSPDIDLFVSKDSLTWYKAKVPTPDSLKKGEFLIIDSSEYSIQIAVKNHLKGCALYTSDSSGVYFSQVLPHVSTDWHINNVELEKAPWLQGVTILNTIEAWNGEDRLRDASTRLKSRISFADGNANSYEAVISGDRRLHLQSEFFSRDPSGIMMGVGNIGEYLSPYAEGDLFISNDAGRNWAQALSGPHKYAFGDNSNLLVAIPDSGPTNKIKYSLDHGSSWEELMFNDHVVSSIYLTSIPDSKSLKFLLLATSGTSELNSYVFALDFETVHERTCENEDMELFSPLREEDDCVMGGKQVYRRRKANASCSVRAEEKAYYPPRKRCKCTESDFECNSGFSMRQGKCMPIHDVSPPKEQCSNSGDGFAKHSEYRLIGLPLEIPVPS